jgi:hypothetical protein
MNNTFNDVVDVGLEFVIEVNNVPNAKVYIESNEFNNSAGFFLGRAIHCRQNSPSGSWRIYGNKIHDKHQGIRLNNIDEAQIHSNEITGLNNNTGSCYGIYVSNSHKTTVEANIITGTQTLTTGDNPTGIIVDAPSEQAYIYCNVTELLGFHILLYSDANADLFEVISNEMTTGSAGICIYGNMNSLSGDIGPQGNNPISFADNNWLGTFGFDRWLYCFNCGTAGAANTIFDMRDSPTSYDASGIYNNSNPSYPTVIANSYTTTVGLFDCSGYGLRNGNLGTMPTWKPNSYFENSHENILYWYKTQRYKLLRETNLLLGVEDSLFIEEMNSTNISGLYEIPVLFSSNDLGSASSLINSIEPNNELEELYTDYYQLYLNYLSNDDYELTSQDHEFLVYLSGLCPELYGSIVGFALNWLGMELEPLSGNCDEQNSKYAGKADKIATLNIFPNPVQSNEFFTISGKIATEKAKISIFDFYGREIKTIDINQGLFTIKENLPAGIYLIRLDQENKNVQSFKVIVTN